MSCRLFEANTTDNPNGHFLRTIALYLTLLPRGT